VIPLVFGGNANTYRFNSAADDRAVPTKLQLHMVKLCPTVERLT